MLSKGEVGDAVFDGNGGLFAFYYVCCVVGSSFAC